MPESTNVPRENDALQPVAALEREIEAARNLLRIERDMEAALREAKPASEVMLLVRRQEEAARATAMAAAARRRCWPAGTSVEDYAGSRPNAEARKLRSLAEEGEELRGALRRVAQRSEYVARRSVEWTQAQMDLLVHWLTRDNAVYRQPGLSRPLRETPSWMDRSA